MAERVMVAVGERDAAAWATERCAGQALRDLTERDGLSLGEAVEWCGEMITVRDATRLRRLATSRPTTVTARRPATVGRRRRPPGAADRMSCRFIRLDDADSG